MILIPLHGGNAVAIDKAILFFGRGSECDVILTDSRKVSRKHCCVAQIDDRIVVRDLGSMNGLRVNETEVRGEGRMSVGDVLWVGDLGFRLEPANPVAGKRSAIAKRVPLPAKKKSKPEVDPRFLSQDLPVAIPDADELQHLDQTANQNVIPDDEVIDLKDSDLFDEES